VGCRPSGAQLDRNRPVIWRPGPAGRRPEEPPVPCRTGFGEQSSNQTRKCVRRWRLPGVRRTTWRRPAPLVSKGPGVTPRTGLQSLAGGRCTTRSCGSGLLRQSSHGGENRGGVLPFKSDRTSPARHGLVDPTVERREVAIFSSARRVQMRRGCREGDDAAAVAGRSPALPDNPLGGL
jgi:hypothetical protein